MSLRRRQTAFSLPMRVWDLPTRLFHWLIVLLLPASWLTAKLHRFDLHFPIGFAILALLVFRLIWGFVGSDTSRFGRFLTSPVAALRHLVQMGKREPDTEVGHNAAGGWFVLVLLLLLAVQVASGLGANDGIGLVEGPLAKHLGSQGSDLATFAHHLTIKLIYVAVAIHLLAIAAYAVVKRHNLTRAMVTGKKRLPATARAPRMASPALALGVLAFAAVVAWAVATQL